MINNQVRRETENRPVVITEVDLANYRVVGRDIYKQNIQASLHFIDPIFVVPQVGETWIFKRKGVDWYLDKKQDHEQQMKKFVDLAPGDVRIEATNLWINGVLYPPIIPDIDPQMTIQQSGVIIGTTMNINLIAGTNITATVAQDPVTKVINITLNAAGALAGTVSPAASLGIAAAPGTIYQRDNSGSGELWVKTGTSDTAWTKVIIP